MGTRSRVTYRLWQPTVSIRTPTKPTSPPATPPLPMPRPPNRFATYALTQISHEEGTCPPVRLQLDCWKRKNQQRTSQLTMKLLAMKSRTWWLRACSSLLAHKARLTEVPQTWCRAQGHTRSTLDGGTSTSARTHTPSQRRRPDARMLIRCNRTPYAKQTAPALAMVGVHLTENT